MLPNSDNDSQSRDSGVLIFGSGGWWLIHLTNLVVTPSTTVSTKLLIINRCTLYLPLIKHTGKASNPDISQIAPMAWWQVYLDS